MPPEADQTHTLKIPLPDEKTIPITLAKGDVLFVMGANGAGKSSLIQRLFSNNPQGSKRISAHRRTWLHSGSLDMTPQQKQQQELNINNNDRTLESRWRDDYDAARPSMALFNLVHSLNDKARSVYWAVRSKDIVLAARLAETPSPIEQLNDLLRLSQLPVTIDLRTGEELIATNDTGVRYSIAEMSDGERSAVLIGADVLTAPEHSLLLIDEPERHLHRSIIRPFLSSLFQMRQDCSFVISTHETALPVDFPSAKVLALRSCEFRRRSAVAWNADILSGPWLDESMMMAILGARRKVLFVEGTSTSRDVQLYSLLFPDVMVISKGGCSEVIRVVKGLRDSSQQHRLLVFGLVDRDNRTSAQVKALQDRGIYAIDLYSVESILYHPDMIRLIAEDQAKRVGENPEEYYARAVASAIEHVEKAASHLTRLALLQSTRNEYESKMPTAVEISSTHSLEVSVNVPRLSNEVTARLKRSVQERDWETIVRRYPIRESGALTAIAKALRLEDKIQYEKVVLTMAKDSNRARDIVKRLLGELPEALLDSEEGTA